MSYFACTSVWFVLHVDVTWLGSSHGSRYKVVANHFAIAVGCRVVVQFD